MTQVKWNLTLMLAMMLALGMGTVACNDDDDADDDGGTDDTSEVDTSGDDGVPTDTGVNTDEEAGETECEDNICYVTGSIFEDTTWTADNTYVLMDGIFVGDDENKTVLTIEPGTVIKGNASSSVVSFLTIRRGSQIMAEGTKDAPIVMTSANDEGDRNPGDWGGLVLNGRAPINCADDDKPCQAFGEGGTGFYGGDDPDDDSGVLKYVRVEFAGRLLSPDNEMNGISFQGVGAGTSIEHIQVHKNADDAIEFYGGTANFKYAYLTGTGDDCLDWTKGWTGKGQFLVAVKDADAGDNGIEADNSGSGNHFTPIANPLISNMTFIGRNKDGDYGALLREGTMGSLHNMIFVDFGNGGACIAVDQQLTWDNMVAGDLNMHNTWIDCDGDNFKVGGSVTDEGDATILEDLFLAANGNAVADKADMLDGFLTIGDALTAATIPADSFFEAVDYIGGVSADDNWVEGWTATPEN